MDFSDLKNALKDICDDFDHSLIYEKRFSKRCDNCCLTGGGVSYD